MDARQTIPETRGQEAMRADAPAGSAPASSSPDQPPVEPWTNVTVLAFAFLVGVLVLAWAASAGSGVVRFNNFYKEAWPSYATLTHGHVLAFVRQGPTYVGSLILRAPFAMVPVIWGGGKRAVYFASALPCMFALALFCMWLAALPRRRRPIRPASRISPIFWCICNPITIIALFGGHPEEILGAVLCVSAVILAAKGRAGIAGLLVGLAVINKSWALVAVPVVFAVLPRARRRAAIALVASVGVVLIPVTIARAQPGANAGGIGGSIGASPIGTIFNPAQLLWWFGPNAWISQHARAGILVVAVIAALPYWWVRRGREDRPAAALADGLLLLAFVFLARAALDPWNNVYYHLPFLYALIAYELSSGRMPLLTILYTLLLLLTVPVGGVTHMTGDARAASYAIVVVPTFAWLAAKIYLPPGSLGRRLRRRASPAAVVSAAPDATAT